ncbi:MAG: hypothetical protein PHC46_03635 [Clostridia bacterium]|nr:hypothetical protein [Clostridia bacterium]
MGDFTSFLIITIIMFVIISMPFIVYIVKHVKSVKHSQREEAKFLIEETEEEFTARITKEIIEKYKKDKKEKILRK